MADPETIDAGAPEVEVTPEMIEAAYDLLFFFDPENGDVEDRIRRIYQAMEAARIHRASKPLDGGIARSNRRG